jgi:hypothetical protein
MMKRNLIILFLLAVLLMVFTVEQAQAWPGWWGPPHRFRVIRVSSYYHWYPHYYPCYRYRPVYVYYPCCYDYWCDCCDCWDCCYWDPCYYCYSPCWHIYCWAGWGWGWYSYWHYYYPPPYYYHYYYAWYGYPYHHYHPWHDYYGDGYGRWRDGYAYRDKPYRTGSQPGRESYYAYRSNPKDRPPKGYREDRQYAEVPVPKNNKDPYELAKIDPVKSLRSTKSVDEYERKNDHSRKESKESSYERVPAVREEDPSKLLDDRKRVTSRKDDGVRGKESGIDDKDGFDAGTVVPGTKKKEEVEKREDEKKEVSKKEYPAYVKERESDKNEGKKNETSPGKETYSKSKSSTKSGSSNKSNTKNNSSSSRFSSPKRDSNSSSNVRRPSSSKRGGKR